MKKMTEFNVNDELDQLLQEQEAFLQQTNVPAAKLHRRSSNSIKNEEMGGITKAEQMKQEYQEQEQSILKPIIERTTTPMSIKLPIFKGIIEKPSSGFPQAQRRNGESRFGRQRREARELKQTSSIETTNNDNNISIDKEIDEMNKEKIANMSIEEIRQAQEELAASLGPELLAKFMKKKPKKMNNLYVPKAMEKNKKMDAPAFISTKERKDMDLSSIKSEEELLQRAQEVLPAEELAKYEWMTNVSIPVPSTSSTVETKETGSLERFDLDGKYIINNSEVKGEEVPLYSGLYHHGDDPTAAGYTMIELLHLARSTVSSQRAFSLGVIAKILHRRQHQIHKKDDVLYPATFPHAMPLQLRCALDDQNYTALCAGIAAYHSYICPQYVEDEEYFCETTFGTILIPNSVQIHPNMDFYTQNRYNSAIVQYVEDSSEEGDPEDELILSERDPIQGAIKMNVLGRIAYLVKECYTRASNTVKDTTSSLQLLKILQAIARHSPKSAKLIATTSKLIENLQSQYLEMVPDGNFIILSIETIKLLRYLCQGDQTTACILLDRGVISCTKGYLAMKTPGSIVPLQIETLRLWRVCLQYGADFNSMSYLFPLLCGIKGPNSSEEYMEVKCPNVYILITSKFFMLEAFCSSLLLLEGVDPKDFIVQMKECLEEANRSLHLWFLFNGNDSNDFTVKSALVNFRAKFFNSLMHFLTASVHLFSLHDSHDHLDTKVIFEEISHLINQKLSLITQHLTVVSRELCCQVIARILRFQTALNEKSDFVVRGFITLPVMLPQTWNNINKVSMSERHMQLIALSDAICSFNIIDIQETEQLQLFKLALHTITHFSDHENYWFIALCHAVIFHPLILQSIECDPDDCLKIRSVLLPVFKQLFMKTDENHSNGLFNSIGSIKSTCHLWLPTIQTAKEKENKPAVGTIFPSTWMYSPLSRMEYEDTVNIDKKIDSKSAAGHAEEMQIVISYVCHYLNKFEIWAKRSGHLLSYTSGDRLFHISHVFFAGSDVLFHESVQEQLGLLVSSTIQGLLHDDRKIDIYQSFIQHVSQLEQMDLTDPLLATSTASKLDLSAFATTVEKSVMTFVEKLTTEYTTHSYGHKWFAAFMAILFAVDFPLSIRKYVWKQLSEARMLATLQVPDSNLLNGQQLLARSTNFSRSSSRNEYNQAWINLLVASIMHNHITPTKGSLMYSIAMYFITFYLFEPSATSKECCQLSAKRQELLHDLLKIESTHRYVWAHLLTYDIHLEAEPCFITTMKTIKLELNQERIQLIKFQDVFSDAEKRTIDTLVQAVGDLTSN